MNDNSRRRNSVSENKDEEESANLSFYDRYVPRFGKAFQGGLCAIEGGMQSLKNPELKTNYARFLKEMSLVALGLYALVGLISFFAAPVFALFGFAPMFQLITMVPLWALSITRKRNPLSSNRLFLSELNTLDSKLASDLEAMSAQTESKSWVSGITSDFLKSMHFMKYSALFTLMGIVPIVGPVLSLAAQLIFNASKLGWNIMTIYTVSCKKMSYKQHKRWIRARRWTLLGFGLVYSSLISIPFVGPLVLGIAQSSSAHLQKFGFYNADVPLKKREKRERDRKEREREMSLSKASEGLAEPMQESAPVSSTIRSRELKPLKISRDAPVFIPMVKEPSFMKKPSAKSFEKKDRFGPMKTNELLEPKKSN